MTYRSRLTRIIQQMLLDEIYNLAARSHLAMSFEEPEDTTNSFLRVEGSPEPERAPRHFRHRVLRMLAEKGAIEESVLRNLLAWPHIGFGTHVSRPIPEEEKTSRIVARYLTRPPITPEQMLGERSDPQFIYRSDAVHPRQHANFGVFDPLDILAEVSAHIPDAHEAIVDMLAEGDKVAVPLRFRGTQHGPMAPYPPSGEVMTADYLASTR